MKGKTIIGLALTLGLFLLGTAAYADWNNNFGPRGGFGKGYGYACGYGSGYGCPYAGRTCIRATGVSTNLRGFRHAQRHWHAQDRRGYGRGWTNQRGYGMIGSRNRW